MGPNHEKEYREWWDRRRGREGPDENGPSSAPKSRWLPRGSRQHRERNFRSEGDLFATVRDALDHREMEAALNNKALFAEAVKLVASKLAEIASVEGEAGFAEMEKVTESFFAELYRDLGIPFTSSVKTDEKE